MKNQITIENIKKDFVEFLVEDMEKSCYFVRVKMSRKGKTFMAEIVPEAVMEHKYLYIEFNGTDLRIASQFFESFDIGKEYYNEMKEKYDIRPR